MVASSKSDLIVAEARSWLGTPYHHAADVKGVGVDCAMLLVRVYVDIGVVPPFDPRPYPPYFYMHRDEERYVGWVKQYGDLVEEAAPGDVALFKFGRATSHGGVCLGGSQIIHAYQVAGKVIISDLQTCPPLASRFQGFWRLKSG